MFHISYIRQIQTCLLKVPEIVNLQQDRSISFTNKVLIWLNELESELKKTQLSEVSKVSALRSKLLTSLHGCDHSIQKSKRKHQEFIASQILQDAQSIVQDSISQKLEQISEAEDIAKKVIAVAYTKGILNQIKSIKSHEAKLRALQSALIQDADTKAAMTHLIGITGMFDIIIVLDQASSGYDF